MSVMPNNLFIDLFYRNTLKTKMIKRKSYQHLPGRDSAFENYSKLRTKIPIGFGTNTQSYLPLHSIS